MLEGIWGKGDPYSLLVRRQTNAGTMEISVGNSQRACYTNSLDVVQGLLEPAALSQCQGNGNKLNVFQFINKIE